MTNFYDSLGIVGVLNISANSNSNAVYISQLGNGNAVLIEDSANPDATPFIINSGGSVNIGRIEYLQTSGGTQPKLQVNNSTSQIPFSGLPFTTNFVVQGFNDNNIGFFTRDNNTSQIYFGSPSSVYGAKLSWYYTGGTFDLSTQTSGGTITFGTGQGLERIRITNEGNVGIGIQTPLSKLHISGNTIVSSSLSASTITITTQQETDIQTTTQYLTRDSSTGLIKTKIIPGPTVYGLFSQTGNSLTISATTVESTLIDGGVGTLTVPANGFSIGDSFRADFGGLMSSKNGDTIRIRIKAGSIVLADSGNQTLNATTDDVWQLTVNFTIRQIGVAGVASIVSLGVFHTTKQSNASPEGFAFNTVNNTTFDTTISNTLDVTVEFSSDSPLNKIYSDIFVLNKIY